MTPTKVLFPVVAFVLSSLLLHAQISPGTEVGLAPVGAENYQLYAQSTGTDRAPGNGVGGGFGVERGAEVLAGPLDGRYQVQVDEGEDIIGGLTGWVEERFILVEWDRNWLRLQWTLNDGNSGANDRADGIEVERSLGDPALLNFVLLATLPRTDNYIDRLVTPGLDHTYRVRAFNSVGKSDYSNTATAMVPLPEPGVDAPAGPTILDLSIPPPPLVSGLSNISGRGLVGVGADIHIGGFVVPAGNPQTVLIRGVGPRLGDPPFNVPGVLSDPQLTLFSGQQVIAQNDNWGGDPAIQAATQSVFAFSLPNGSEDAALLLELAPGPYTVHLSGVDGATGVALLEIYAVPTPPTP